MNKKNVITAISFLYKGERLKVEAGYQGKFKVPVTEIRSGKVKTVRKSLSARQVVEHNIIKNCDPTLYLSSGERVRVYLGGDPGYLPAESDGIITKHDEAHKPRFKKREKTKPTLSKSLNGYGSSHAGVVSPFFDGYDFGYDADDS